ncbi:DUF4199 domain-containing protein [Alteromonas sp. KUL49]|uniref:DUF4199 domain-containing protein n=1 Tax=Alteromonas sp. KUL49 TaxID=2480798 RepID=UPI00102F235D|nr:DUF4199 domain-containing protein [Alteromonas sp. KUL49]TAP40766.1 DUF4199 domain-containing protein [Alteromonas sp. KUL49]GEA10935.1 hypothetical protein KUL49_13100 [Alteromonas sp. KUL49]
MQVKSIITEVKWGLIFVAMLLCWMVLERLGGFHGERIDLHMYVTNLIMIPAIAIYVFALRNKREADYQGNMTYFQGFTSGLIIAVVVCVVSPLTQWLISNVISPDYFPNIIEYVVANGQMTREEAEGYFNYESYVVQSMVGAIVMGAITAAVVSVFVKRTTKTTAD